MDKVKSRDGTVIAYERSGEGQPLVLVHGTGGDHTRWSTVLPEFERHFSVYAIDRRGRGRSGDAPVYAIESEYEDVAAVVDSIGRPVNLLGHSYGGICALEAALLSSNIRKLVLYEPSIPVGIPLYPLGAKERLQTILDTGDMEELLMAFMRDIVEIPQDQIEMIRSLPTWENRLAAAHTIPREFADADYVLAPERFKSFYTPTLLLMGGDSLEALKKATEVLGEVLPNCRIVEMPGQQHIAMNTAPEMFSNLVIEFLLNHE